MYFLVIDTSYHCQISLYKSDVLLSSVFFHKNEALISEVFLKSVNKLIESSAIYYKDLSFCSIVIGPGFFTSIRIGIVFVKMLKLSFGICIFVYNSLYLMSYNVQALYCDKLAEDDMILSVYDIGKSQGAIVSVYAHKGLGIIKDSLYLTWDDLNDFIQNSLEFIWIAINKNQEKLSYFSNVMITSVTYPDIDIIAKLSLVKFSYDKRGDANLIPFYGNNLGFF